MQAVNQPLVYTIRETATRAGIPVAFMRRLVADGIVHAVRSGNRFYVTWASVERYLLGQEEQAAISAERKHG